MSIFWAYVKFRIALWVLRMTGRVVLFAVLVAVLVAAAPVTVVTVVGVVGAWLRGWPPARLWRAGVWSLPMTAVYLAGRALARPVNQPMISSSERALTRVVPA